MDPCQDGSGSFAEIFEEGFLGGKGKGGLASIDECGLMIDDWEGAKRRSITTEDMPSISLKADSGRRGRICLGRRGCGRARRWSFTTEVTEVHRGRTQYPPEG